MNDYTSYVIKLFYFFLEEQVRDLVTSKSEVTELINLEQLIKRAGSGSTFLRVITTG